MIVSDKAKIFAATNSILRKLIVSEEAEEYLKVTELNWGLLVFTDPWCVGVVERVVCSLKMSLRKVLTNAKLSNNELNTTLVEIEATMANRPLTYAYDEADEMLTPAHLMYVKNSIRSQMMLKTKRMKLAFKKDTGIWQTEQGISGIVGNVSI